MAQDSYVIDYSKDGGTVGSRMDDIFLALRSMNQGPTAPGNPVNGMLWADTSAVSIFRLKQYLDGTWYTIITIDTVAGAAQPLPGVMVQSDNLAGLADIPNARFNLGLKNKALGAEVVSTLDPSGGSNGDVWYKVA